MKNVISLLAVGLMFISTSFAQYEALTTWVWNGSNAYITVDLDGSTTSAGEATALSLVKYDGTYYLQITGLGYLCGNDLEIVDRDTYVSIDGVRYTGYNTMVNGHNAAFVICTPTLIGRLKAGNYVTITFSDGCGIENSGTHTLNGFTRAYNNTRDAAN